MSTLYAGKKIAIVSSTNATPIQITATAHGYTAAQLVNIAGHLVNTNANGEWAIIVVDANNFTLTGSVGNGVGGATGSATSFVTSITVPSDGDADVSAVRNTAVIGCADREQVLKEDYEQRLAGMFPFGGIILTRVCGGTPFATTATWLSNVGNVIWINATLGGTLILPLRLPHGCTVTAGNILYQGAGAHGALPANMPTMQFVRTNKTTGAATSLSTAVDPSGTTGAFQASHVFGFAGLSHIVDAVNYQYYYVVTAESGANALTGAFYQGGPDITFTMRALDIGVSP